MSDKIIGNLTDDHQHINGSLVSTDVHISGVLSPRSRNLNGRIDANGTRDYNHLFNKPKINSVELVGDKSFPELGIRTISSGEILDILDM